jgi:hypothetical protein
LPQVDVTSFILPEDLIAIEGLRLEVEIEDLTHLGKDVGEPTSQCFLIKLYLWLHQLLSYALILVIVALVLIIAQDSQVDVSLNLYLCVLLLRLGIRLRIGIVEHLSENLCVA